MKGTAGWRKPIPAEQGPRKSPSPTIGDPPMPTAPAITLSSPKLLSFYRRWLAWAEAGGKGGGIRALLWALSKCA